MTIESVKRQIIQIGEKFRFINSINLIDETDFAVKFRFEIDSSTFIQIYHNTSTGTKNYILIRDLRRCYSRDCYDGKWHRHPFNDPSNHDFSLEGSKNVTLYDFLKEVEDFLIKSKQL